jgi:hypothetical protein
VYGAWLKLRVVVEHAIGKRILSISTH